MAKKRSHGYDRTRFVGVRMSEHDYQRLKERAVRAGAKTPSAYIRAACLTGQEFELPPWEHLRALINAMVECTGELRKAGYSKALEAKALDAFDRISRF
jgi:mobilization protein NikA